MVRTDGVPRGDGFPRAGRRWCSIDSSDPGHDHDGRGRGRGRVDGDGDYYLRGWRCFRKLRSSVRAMVDEEVPASGPVASVCAGSRTRRTVIKPQSSMILGIDSRLTVKIAQSARPSSSSFLPSVSVSVIGPGRVSSPLPRSTFVSLVFRW